MQIQVSKGHTDLVQANLFALGLEFLIQQPVSGGGVLQRCLAYLLVERVTVMLFGTARRRAVLMVPPSPVRHAGVLREPPEAELRMALPEDDRINQRQSRRTFREISSSSSFSARMRPLRSFSRSRLVTP